MFSGAVVAAVSLGFVRLGNADLIPVPVDRQAELLARVAAYDRNMAARAGDRVRVLLVINVSDPESVVVARRMEAALRSLPCAHGARGTASGVRRRRRPRRAMSVAAYRDRLLRVRPGRQGPGHPKC